MTVSRREVVRYGIAIDLVILATGVGLLYPGHAMLLVFAFVGAAGLSAWKGGWKGGWTAIAASLLISVAMFDDSLDASGLAAIVAASIATCAIVRAFSITKQQMPMMRAAAPSMPIAMPMPDVMAFDPVPAEAIEDEEIVEQAATPAPEIDEDEEEARLARQREEEIEAERARVAREREEEIERARVIAAEEQARIARERAAAEEETRIARERAAAAEEAERARVAREREEADRAETERRSQLEAEMRAATEEARRLHSEAIERARQLEEEKRAAELDAERRLMEQRAALQQELEERLAREREEKRIAEETLERRLAEERAGFEKELESRISAERVAFEAKHVAERARPAASQTPRVLAKPARGILDTVSSWFRPKVAQRAVNLNNRKPAAASRRAPQAPPPRPARPAKKGESKSRLLLFERRRGTAETALPRLRQMGVECEVVERLVDAVDELFRFRPHAILIDGEMPDLEKCYRTIAHQNPNLPIFMTGRSPNVIPSGSVRYAAFIPRPYDVDELVHVAQTARTDPARFLAQQTMMTVAPSSQRPAAAQPSPSAGPVAPPRHAPKPLTVSPEAPRRAGSGYDVTCFHCRSVFDAMEGDWCSCLTKERTIVCTNCLTCFCKAPPAYKEKFWVEAPPALFERKTSDTRRAASITSNPPVDSVIRPLVLSVEDDDEIQHIVHRVCSNLGYGFIYASNGQDGMDLAHAYHPNLILSDAFMPKLDGREMCRLLKEEPAFADTRMIVMTGLYTDTKYRSEALKRFHVDDYLSKPVAITELINLLQKHLEGVTGLPAQEDMYEIHRQSARDDEEHAAAMEEYEEAEGVSLATLLEEEEARERGGAGTREVEEAPVIEMTPASKPKSDAYDVCCFTCQNMFDASRAEWCSCVGRDNTLLCPHCNGCFCKAPPAYRERFWIDAPPSLFERKMLGSKRNITVAGNPRPDEVKRPLILLVEDDENVQLIVRTVVTTMGFGFVVGANGQEGLTLAHEYNPDLILSDAFMPKLDGREMCRLLKLDPTTARVKAIIMTGLYTDRKYRNEALDYFKVDDYVAKPLAVDDLIRLFKKHLPQEVQQTM